MIAKLLARLATPSSLATVSSRCPDRSGRRAQGGCAGRGCRDFDYGVGNSPVQSYPVTLLLESTMAEQPQDVGEL